MADSNQVSSVDNKSSQSVGLIEFVRQTRRELAKVTWPTRKETMVTTALIVGMAIVVGLFYFAVDTALGYLIGRILGMRGT